MVISQEERERRRETIGGSDVYKILGLDLPWSTPTDVQFEKVSGVDSESGPDAKLGDKFEKPLVLAAMEELGVTEWEEDELVLDPTRPFHANLDACTKDAVVEAKFTSMDERDEWGDPGTDQVPDKVLVQVTWQMALKGRELAVVASLFTGRRREWALFEVPLNQRLAERLQDSMLDWWEKHVVRREPCLEVPSWRTIKGLRREPGKVVVVDPELVRRYVLAQRMASDMEKAKKEAQRELLAALGDAEAGVDHNGETLFTYMKQKRKEFTVKASENPTLKIPKAVQVALAGERTKQIEE